MSAELSTGTGTGTGTGAPARLPHGAEQGALAGVRITMPGDWSELALDPASRRRGVRAAVREACVRQPGLVANRAQLIGTLDDLTLRAQRAGAFYCASLAMHGGAGLLVAAVLLQLGPPLAPDDLAARLDRAALCAGLAVEVAGDPQWAGADVEVRALPAVGPAVRALMVAGGVCLQYLAPLPSTPHTLLATFSSPCADYAEPLVELFDAMAGSLSPSCV